MFVGRRSRARTCDLSLVRAALSQLSYPPVPSRLGSEAPAVKLPRPRYARNYARETLGSVLEISRAHDVVPIEHDARPVARDVMVTRWDSPRLHHVPDGSPPEFVADPPSRAGLPGRCGPGFPVVPPALTEAMLTTQTGNKYGMTCSASRSG